MPSFIFCAGPRVSTLSIVYPLLMHLASCYSIQEFPASFDDAKLFCETNCTSQLASIHNDSQNQMVLNLANPLKSYVWIGGMRIDNHNNWTWLDNSIFDFGNDTSGGAGPWFSGNSEPNNAGGVQNCLRLYFGQTFQEIKGWEDASCNHPNNKHPFICNNCPEMEFQSTTLSPIPVINDTVIQIYYGLSIEIAFEYTLNSNNTTLDVIVNTLSNITNILIDNTANQVISDTDCVSSNDYDTNIKKPKQYTNELLINSTLFVCDESSQTALYVNFNQTLQTDFIDAVSKDTNILLIVNDSIKVNLKSFCINCNENEVTTTIMILNSDSNISNVDDNSNNQQYMEIIIISCVITVALICIGLMTVLIFKNRRFKQRSSKQTASDNPESRAVKDDEMKMENVELRKNDTISIEHHLSISDGMYDRIELIDHGNATRTPGVDTSCTDGDHIKSIELQNKGENINNDEEYGQIMDTNDGIDKHDKQIENAVSDDMDYGHVVNTRQKSVIRENDHIHYKQKSVEDKNYGQIHDTQK